MTCRNLLCRNQGTSPCGTGYSVMLRGQYIIWQLAYQHNRKLSRESGCKYNSFFNNRQSKKTKKLKRFVNQLLLWLQSNAIQ